MPGPTTERLDEDYRSLREDMHDIKVILARLDARLDAFDEDVRANTTGLTALDVRMGSLDARAGALDARLGIVDARLAWLVGAGKWLGSIFALAALRHPQHLWATRGCRKPTQERRSADERDQGGTQPTSAGNVRRVGRTNQSNRSRRG